MVYQHKCPKCLEQYESNDEDVYFCDQCIEVRKQIAKKIDAQLANREPKKESKSGFQTYEEIRRLNGGKYPTLGQMGIDL